MRTYWIMRASGIMEKIHGDEPLPLEKLQEIVGGYIEFVPHEKGTLCVNEDGLSKGLRPNAFIPGIVGDAVIGELIKGTDGDEFVGIEGEKQP